MSAGPACAPAGAVVDRTVTSSARVVLLWLTRVSSILGPALVAGPKRSVSENSVLRASDQKLQLLAHTSDVPASAGIFRFRPLSRPRSLGWDAGALGAMCLLMLVVIVVVPSVTRRSRYIRADTLVTFGW